MKYFFYIFLIPAFFISESRTEPDKVELCPGNIEELKKHLAKILLFLHRSDKRFCEKEHDYCEEKCKWHYRKMKNNENITCKLTEERPFLKSGEPYVYLPDVGNLVNKQYISDSVASCDCWELNNEDQKENIFVFEVTEGNQEFVFTLMEKRQTKYILELQSGWKNT